MSDDVSALTALFGGASQTYAPGTYGSVYDVGSVQGASPFPDSYQPPAATDYSGLLKGAMAIGEAGRSIGAGRAATAEGRIANKIASIEAQREKMKGRRLVSTAKAVAGAQGSGNPGDTLVSELTILQAAHENANVKLYEGNVAEYYARQKAKAAYMKAPADLLEGLLEATKPGKSLLTGK